MIYGDVKKKGKVGKKEGVNRKDDEEKEEEREGGEQKKQEGKEKLSVQVRVQNCGRIGDTPQPQAPCL